LKAKQLFQLEPRINVGVAMNGLYQLNWKLEIHGGGARQRDEKL